MLCFDLSKFDDFILIILSFRKSSQCLDIRLGQVHNNCHTINHVHAQFQKQIIEKEKKNEKLVIFTNKFHRELENILHSVLHQQNRQNLQFHLIHFISLVKKKLCRKDDQNEKKWKMSHFLGQISERNLKNFAFDFLPK